MQSRHLLVELVHEWAIVLRPVQTSGASAVIKKEQEKQMISYHRLDPVYFDLEFDGHLHLDLYQYF